MKFAIVAIAFAAAVRATELPKCALGCFASAVTDNTNCAFDDMPCICANSEKIQGDPKVASCVMDACGMDVAMNQVLPAAKSMCNGVKAPAATSAPAAKPTVVAPPAAPTYPPSSSAPAAAAPTYPPSSIAPVDTYVAPKPSSTVVAVVHDSSSSSCVSSTAVATFETKPSPTPLVNATYSTPAYSGPTETPIYTAGAASLSSVGGLAVVLVAALAL